MDKYLREYTTGRERERLESFKRRLRQAARARGYASFSRLAEEAGLTETSFRHYLTGRRLPSAASLMRLSDTLDVPVDWLLGSDPADIAARSASLALMLVPSGTPADPDDAK